MVYHLYDTHFLYKRLHYPNFSLSHLLSLINSTQRLASAPSRGALSFFPSILTIPFLPP